jgi:hypothetical protein
LAATRVLPGRSTQEKTSAISNVKVPCRDTVCVDSLTCIPVSAHHHYHHYRHAAQPAFSVYILFIYYKVRFHLQQCRRQQSHCPGGMIALLDMEWLGFKQRAENRACYSLIHAMYLRKVLPALYIHC